MFEVGLRRKEKANRPSKLQDILLACYMELGPGSQESRVYLGIVQLRHGRPVNWNFGIKSFYPKIRGHVFTPKFGRRMREFKGFQNYANQGIDCIRIDIS